MESRSAPIVATACVLLFWVGTAVAGSLAEGYSPRSDVISNLAGRGSSVAVLGVASILILVVAHVASSRVLTGGGARPTARLLLAAAVATLAIAVFRVSCPAGAAGCGGPSSEDDLADVIHVLAVASYAVLIVAAMVSIVVRAPHRPRWLAVTSAVFAVASVAFLAATAGDDPGLWQRLWVGTNLGWLLVATWSGPRLLAQE